MDLKTYFSIYGAVPFYDPFETDDFFYKTSPHAASLSKSGKNIDFSNPRNLYKSLLVDTEYLNGRTVPMSDSLSIEDLKKEDHSGRFQEAKLLFEKNYRLYSSNWTDYEKKKVTAAYSMLQLVEFNHKLYLRGKMDLDSIDFRMLRDLIKNCIGDETFLLTFAILMMTLPFFKEIRCYNLIKFFLIAMQESTKIVQATEMVQKNLHVKANPSMTFKEALLYQDLNNMEMKLFILKRFFHTSIDFLVCGEESNLAGYDEANSKILMEIFKGQELSDPEFAAIPTKIRNYEDAEKTAKLMTRMSQKMLDLAQKNSKSMEVINKWMRLVDNQNERAVHIPTLLKMKEFYAGFVYYATAYFHPNKNVKYKMMKKSIGYLETLMKSGDLTEFPQMTQDIAETCMILSDAYAVSWNIKYEMYQEKPSKDDWNLIKSLVAYRVQLGNELQHAMVNEHRRISTMYDLVKCYTLVLKDNATAETKTGELIDFLIENPKVLDFFQKLSGVRVSKLVNKPLLISAIINSCK